MATDTLRPTTHTTAGTVDDPANGYNGNTGNNALLKQASIGGTSHEQLYSFPAGDVDPNSRTAVTLNVHAEWSTADQYDSVQVLVRARAGDAWTTVDEKGPNSVPTWSPVGGGQALRQFDITSLAAAHAATGWQLRLVFYNGDAGNPDPPAEGA